MEGKTGLIMGVANERSIAWGIANQLFLNKANIVLTYQNDSLKKRIEPLSEKINCKSLYKCVYRPCNFNRCYSCSKFP